VIAMPMVYISKEAQELLEKIDSFLKKNVKHGRILKADILYEALKAHAEKLGIK
jgi:hypothetical protein